MICKLIQLFYAERMAELFDMNTLDSYRVRANNTLSLLMEMLNVCKSYTQGNIKTFETVRGCGDELMDALKKEGCIIEYDTYGKETFVTELDNFLKSNGEIKNGYDIKKMTFLLETCINENTNTYNSRLFEQVEKILFDVNFVCSEKGRIEAMEKLEYLTKELSYQMISAGFSKRFLYKRLSDLRRACKVDINKFKELYDEMKDEITVPQLRNYTIVFKVFMSKKVEGADKLDMFCTDVDNEIIPKVIQKCYKKLFSLTESNYLVVEQGRGLDSMSTLLKSKEHLFSKLDTLQHGGSVLKMWPYKMALIYEHETKFNKLFPINLILDGSFQPDIDKIRDVSSKFEKVLSSGFVDDDTKERLKSALRHLRIANEDSEIEQQFLNYWLALEFVYSSPLSAENTFTRIKKYLVDMLLCCYIKRNMLYINKELIRKDIISQDEIFWEKTEEELKRLIKSTSISSPLLSLRLSKMKSRIHGKTARNKRECYLKNNEKNVVRHLIRMYRLRNELVHEAAIKQNIQNVTSNLRYYLVFTINHLVDWLLDAEENKRETGIEEMFYHYEILRKSIFKDFDFDRIMSVKLNDGLIK